MKPQTLNIPVEISMELVTPRQKLDYVADLEAEVEDWRGVAQRLLDAWPDDDAAFLRAMGELVHLLPVSQEPPKP